MNLHPDARVLQFLIILFALALAPVARAQWRALPVSPAPVVELEYDAQGNVTKSIQAPGQTGFSFATAHDHDSLGRLIRSTDARGKVSSFGYDGQEGLLHFIDPRGLVTQYLRNGLGNVTGLVSPDTGSETYTRDAAGNVLTRTDSRGITGTYAYDALNRLISLTYEKPGLLSQAYVWNYDETGPGFSYGVGRLTSMRFPSGTATFAYDAWGRHVSTTQTLNFDTGMYVYSLPLTTAYNYDQAGHVVNITYPSGRVLNITYAGGVPTAMSLAAANGGSRLPLIEHLRFEPARGSESTPISWDWQLDSGILPNLRDFDVHGRLVRYPLAGIRRDLKYDQADRIVSYSHWDASSGTAVPALDQIFSYDELGRLTEAATGAGKWTFEYDDNGNRTGVNYTAGSIVSLRNYSIDPASNRLMGIDNPERTFEYDEAGNIILDSEGVVAHDARVQASGQFGEMIFLYRSGRRNGSLLFVNDGFGRRILKRGGVRSFCNNTPTGLVCGGPAAFEFVAYAYDQEGHLLGEYSMPNGNVLREYVWLGDMPVAVIDGSPANPTIYYVQTDHLNTPRAVLDRSGRQRWSWIVEPFGSGLPIEDPLGLGAFKLNLRMPGQYFDEQSGLIYNWHRIYDESIGRYTQPDPIGLSGGINTYAYVGGDPVSRVDPMGLAQCFYSISSGQMNCYSDFPSQTGFSGQFASGNNSIPGCKNNPACISESGVGPIPTGYWYWDPQGASGKPGGRVLVPIQVDAVRSNIRSHSCDNPLGPSKVGPFCSEGCLTGTVSTIGALNQFLGSEWAGGVSNTLRVGP